MSSARRSVAALVALVATLLLAGSATAHALPQSSDPSPGANVATAPTAVTITFGERPDPKLSTIKVLDTGGNLVSTGPDHRTSRPIHSRSRSPLQPLSPGVYTVAWRTVSAVDGHLATGSFAFGVGVAPSPARVRRDGGIGHRRRWRGAVGRRDRRTMAAVPRIARSARCRDLRDHRRHPVDRRCIGRLLPLAWIVAAVGSGIVIAVEVADSGAALGDILGSSIGSGILLRGLPLLVAGDRGRDRAASTGPRRTRARGARRRRRPAGGRPAEPRCGRLEYCSRRRGPGAPRHRGRPVAGRPRRPAPDDRADRRTKRTARAARRFSWLATIGIATVAVTGLLRAIAEVGTVDALLSTDFGHLVIAKTALLATLALLGAVNHFRNVPAAGRSVRGPRRVGSVELLVGATVLLLTASLVNLAPPVEVAAAAAAPSPSPSLAAAGRGRQRLRHVGEAPTRGLARDGRVRLVHRHRDRLRQRCACPGRRGDAAIRASGPSGCRQLAARPDDDGTRASSRRAARTCRSTGHGRSPPWWPVAPRRSRSRSS